MREDEVYVELFGFGSNTTFYSWKKNPKRIIFKLLEKYFIKEEIEEFLRNGKIQKMENNRKIEKYYQASKLVYLNLDFSKIFENTEAEKFYFLFLHYIAKNGNQYYTFTSVAMSFVASVYVPSSTSYFNKILKFNIMPILNALDSANLYAYISNIFASEEYVDLANNIPEELESNAKSHIALFLKYSQEYELLLDKHELLVENTEKIEFLQDMYNNFRDTKYFKEYIKKLDISESELDNYFLK